MIVPQSAALETVLRALAALGGPPAGPSPFATEMAAVVADLVSPGAGGTAPQATIVDAAGAKWALDTTDTQAADISWVAPCFRGGCGVAAQMSLLPPYPRLQVIGGPSRLQSAQGGVSDAVGLTTPLQTVHIVVVSGDHVDVQTAQREALLLGHAYQRLVMRNPSLGGLVANVTVATSVEPGGGGQIRTGGSVAAAHIVLDVLSLLVAV